MAKLRKTLPKDFKEVVKRGDAEEIKASLKKCEPNAHYSAFDERTALMNTDLPPEVISEELFSNPKIWHCWCRSAPK